MKAMQLLSKHNLNQTFKASWDVIDMLNSECAKDPDHCPDPAGKILFLLRASEIVQLLRCCLFLLSGCFLLGLLHLFLRLFVL